jgi:hypothetical protein
MVSYRPLEATLHVCFIENADPVGSQSDALKFALRQWVGSQTETPGADPVNHGGESGWLGVNVF